VKKAIHDPTTRGGKQASVDHKPLVSRLSVEEVPLAGLCLATEVGVDFFLDSEFVHFLSFESLFLVFVPYMDHVDEYAHSGQEGDGEPADEQYEVIHC
jgi:hypothetical protein